jgi:hypothetical protein
MKISSLAVDSIKSTLRKRLGKKSKTSDAPSNNEPAKASYESRDDEVQVYAVTTREDVQDLRDDAERDATVVPVRTEIEVEAPTIKDVSNKQTSGGARGKIKGLFSPVIRAISLRKKRVPRVSKVLKVNSQKQEPSTFAELKEAPSAAVDELLQDFKPPRCAQHDNVSCASFEVIQFFPGSEHVENEEGLKIPEEHASKATDADAEVKSTEAEIQVASLLCMDTDDLVKDEIKEVTKDEHPTEQDEPAPSTSVESLDPDTPSTVLVSNETQTAVLSSSEADSSDITTEVNLNEEHPRPSAPTLSKLPPKEVVENSSLEPGVLDVGESKTEADGKTSEGSSSENTKANKSFTQTLTGRFNEKKKAKDAKKKKSVPDTGVNMVSMEHNNEVVVMERNDDAKLPSKEVAENPLLEPCVLDVGESKTEVDNEALQNDPAKEVTSGSKSIEANKKCGRTLADKFNKKMKAKDTKKKDSVNACKTRRTVNVEHLFQPSEIPLERSVSDTEVIMISTKHDDNVEEAYELVKPASWHGVERQFADSEDEGDDDSVNTHLSGIEEGFSELSTCGLTEGLHDTLIWWGEKVFNVCPEPGEATKQQMIDTARSYEEAAYIMRDICHGKC